MNDSSSNSGTLVEETSETAISDTGELSPDSGAKAAPSPATDSSESLAQSGPSDESGLNNALRAQSYLLNKQLFWARLGAIFTGGILAIFTALFIVIFPLVPKLSGAVDEINETMSGLQPVIGTIEALDISGTLKNINSLVTESRSGITEALRQLESAQKKIEAFDVERLNSAIYELNRIISPLARLFGK